MRNNNNTPQGTPRFPRKWAGPAALGLSLVLAGLAVTKDRIQGVGIEDVSEGSAVATETATEGSADGSGSDSVGFVAYSGVRMTTDEEQEAWIANLEREMEAERLEMMRPENMSLGEALRIEENPDAHTWGERTEAESIIWEEMRAQPQEYFMESEQRVRDLIELETAEEQVDAIREIGLDTFDQVLRESESEDIHEWVTNTFLTDRAPSPTSENFLRNTHLDPEFLGTFEPRSSEENASILGNTSTPSERLNLETAQGFFGAIVISYERYTRQEIDAEELGSIVRIMMIQLSALAKNGAAQSDALDYMTSLIVDPVKREYMALYDWQFGPYTSLLSGNKALSTEHRIALLQFFMSAPALDVYTVGIRFSRRGRLIVDGEDQVVEYVIANSNDPELVEFAQEEKNERILTANNERRRNMTLEEIEAELLE